jgi:hypothetical protein
MIGAKEFCFSAPDVDEPSVHSSKPSRSIGLDLESTNTCRKFAFRLWLVFWPRIIGLKQFPIPSRVTRGAMFM